MQKKNLNISYIILQCLCVVGMIFFLTIYALDKKGNVFFDESLINFLNFTYCFALSFLPWLVKKFKIKFTKFLETYFLIAIIAHFVIGGTFHMYKTLYYSFAIHFLNSFTMGVVCFGILLRNNRKQGKLQIFLTTLACVALIGMLWELVEFSYDSFFNGNMQKAINSKTNVPFVGKRALWDTMYDICMDVLGGVLAGLLSAIKIKGKPIYHYVELRSAVYRKSLFGEIEYIEANITKPVDDKSSEENKKGNDKE